MTDGMRLNKYLALYAGLSRRSADKAIEDGRAAVNGRTARLGQTIAADDEVSLDGRKITASAKFQTILLNKPTGYVCSRVGQGSKTIYDLLPDEFNALKPAGRLDKDSSGLLVLTNDGQLAHELTHPSYQKTKVYEIKLNKELTEADFEKITQQGVKLDDGISRFRLDCVNGQNYEWKITMNEGRNRQIRRTFAALGYKLIRLHRKKFGAYAIGTLREGRFEAAKALPD